MGFRLVQKLVTLNDLERHNCRYFAVFQRKKSLGFGAHCVKVTDEVPKLSTTKCSPELVVFSDISLTMI